MIEIVPVTAIAAPALADVHAQAFDEPWPAAEIAALIASPGAIALAAMVDGDLAGFILARIAADEAEVLTLATARASRRRGAAARLLTAARLAARAGGAGAMFLEVAEDNPAALALYRGQGFGEVGARPGYYRRPGGEAAAARIMRLDLNR